MRLFVALLAVLIMLSGCARAQHHPRAPLKPWDHGPLQVSPDGHYFQHADGTPFFWLGDTSWLLSFNLDRDEIPVYLNDRAARGFNVVQVSILHNTPGRNTYRDRAVAGRRDLTPLVTPGNDPNDPEAYDYWDHLDYIVEQAAERGIYIAMVAIWGSGAERGALTPESAPGYGRFLGERYRDHPNIIWLNGGDTMGDQYTEAWLALAEAIKAADPVHLMTFHPFGRRGSAEWFHDARWLDFNMFQSGHRRYDQVGEDDPATWKGEDNWRHVEYARGLKPSKPVLDGEPSYEAIPQGLHDWTEPLWQPADARRYAWWSVMAGAAGHTYGHGALMGMRRESYFRDGVMRESWADAIHAPGAGYMTILKNLLLSRPYFSREPDPGAVVDQAERYDRVIACRGDGYMLAYVYTGRPFTLRLGRMAGDRVRARWYSPRDGHTREIGTFANTGEREFTPPRTPFDGNDWVLVLDDPSRNFPPPGKSNDN